MSTQHLSSHEPKSIPDTLNAVASSELLDGIGSHRASQDEHDQRSCTRLREAAQRQTACRRTPGV